MGKKLSERIVKRMGDMGLVEPSKSLVFAHQNSRHGGVSWSVACGSFDIGCCSSMTEAIKWKRWIYSRYLHEIFEYHEGDTIDRGDIVEER